MLLNIFTQRDYIQICKSNIFSGNAGDRCQNYVSSQFCQNAKIKLGIKVTPMQYPQEKGKRRHQVPHVKLHASNNFLWCWVCLSSSFGLKINKLSISLPRLLLAFVNAIKLFVLATFFTFTRHLIIRNQNSKYCYVWCHANWVFNPKSTPSEINKHPPLKDFEKIPISPLSCLLSTRECF